MAHTAYRILIVDDDNSILFLMQKMLEKEGYVTFGAENAFDALKILENTAIDLVLSDITMPKMDGLEFLKRLKQMKPHIPVVIMTADPNLPKVKTALSQGALEFLEKPFDLDKIFSTIQRFAAERIHGRVVSLAQRRFLLITANEKKQYQLERAIIATQCKITKVENEKEALDALIQERFDLVIYAIGDKYPSHLFFEYVYTKTPDIKSICVAEEYDSDQLNHLIQIPFIDAIIFKNQVFSESDFIAVIRKLFSKDIFGMEKYMSWGVEPIQHTTTHTNDRFRFTEMMSQYLKSLHISTRFVARMENVADEFLTNALYNAPVDKDGNPLYRELDRKIGRDCNEREKCILSYAYDGHHFGLSIQDQFGSITKKQIFDGIKRCLEEGAVPSQKAGGAGLGLYFSYITLNKFIINIQPGRKTEMIGLCDLRTSLKNFDLSDKSLCIFVIN